MTTGKSMRGNRSFTFQRMSSVARSFTEGDHLKSTSAFVFDQVVCSAGNFLTSFMAARHLQSDQFGSFALLNLISVFSLTVNNWLVRSSLSKTSQLANGSELRTYTSTLAWLAGCFGILVAGILCIAASCLGHPELMPALMAVALGSQVQELLRRSAMAQFRYRIGILGDAVSYLGQALLVVVLVASEQLSLNTLFWAMAITSTVSVLVQAAAFRLPLPSGLGHAAQVCWEQGRWVTLSGLILSPIVYGLPWIVEVTRGQVEAGKLSSLFLILGLSNPIMFSSTWLILIRGQVARHAALGEMWRRVLPVWLLTAIPLFVLWGAVLVLPHPVLILFYSKKQAFTQLTGTLQLVVVFYVATYLAVCLEVLTDARDRSRQRVRIDTGVAAIMLTVGVAICSRFGITGLLYVALSCNLLRTVLYAALLIKAPSQRPILTISPEVSL